MQKIIRRIALFLTVALSVICIGIVASACNEEKTTGYKVTVVYPDDTAVNGTTDGYNKYDEEDTVVTVQICVVGGASDGQCFDKVPLGEDGKATIPEPDYTLGEGETFKVQVNNVPQGYDYDYAYVTESGETTIKLKVSTEA